MPSKLKYFRPWLDSTSSKPETRNVDRHPYSLQPGTSGIHVNQTAPGIQSDEDENTQVIYRLVESYTFLKKGERVFAKNKANKTTYELKFNEHWRGENVTDIQDWLQCIFQDILSQFRVEGADLGREVIQNNGLNSPIVIPLQNLDSLNLDTVMDGITKVLNSNEELVVDDSMSVTIGFISIPKGSGSNL